MRKNMSLRQYKNQGGYITILIMAMMAVTAVVASSIIDKQLLTRQMLTSGRRDADIYYLQQKLISTIYNNEAWNNQTAQTQCMSAGTGCPTPPVGSSLILRDQTGNIINDSTNPSFGYTSDGNACTSYSTDGNDECPLKFTLTWTPTACNAGVCVIRVQGKFSYSPKNIRIMMNPSRYDFDILRGKETESLQAACQSLNGNFQQNTDACSVNPAADVKCPAGQYMVRSKNSGIAQCRPSFASTEECPDGSAAVGFKEHGQLDCRSILDWK